MVGVQRTFAASHWDVHARPGASTMGTAGGCTFNLQTTGCATGAYNPSFTAGSDPTVYAVQFEVK